jgi:hypothetical protein
MSQCRAFRPFVLVFALAGVSGCSVLGLSNGADRDRLNDERRAWNAQHISSYSYTYRAGCFCPPSVTDSVRIVVRHDTIASMTYIDSGLPVEPNVRSLFHTIPGLFDLLEDALDRDADDFRVTYDARYHFPSDANIDYMKNAADEELGFRVTSFQRE